MLAPGGGGRLARFGSSYQIIMNSLYNYVNRYLLGKLGFLNNGIAIINIL